MSCPRTCVLRGDASASCPGTYYEPPHLQHPLGNGLPATYIACSEPYFISTALSRKIAGDAGLGLPGVPTGHDAMVLMPRELPAMLAAIV
jgi:hypothetical protein